MSCDGDYGSCGEMTVGDKMAESEDSKLCLLVESGESERVRKCSLVCNVGKLVL